MKKFMVLYFVIAIAFIVAFSFLGDLIPLRAEGTEVEKYTVVFYNEHGVILETKRWRKDSIPGFRYEKQNTSDWIFVVRGWAEEPGGEVLPSLPPVTADTAYYAIVKKTPVAKKVVYSGKEKTTADYKRSALAALESAMAAMARGASLEVKSELGVNFEITSSLIRQSDGELTEIISQADRLYSSFCASAAYGGEDTESVSGESALACAKEAALAKMDLLYENATMLVGEAPMLKAAYDEAELTVHGFCTPDAGPEDVSATYSAFCDAVEEATAEELEREIRTLKAELAAETAAPVAEILPLIRDADLKEQLQAVLTAELEKIGALTSAADLPETRDAAARAIREAIERTAARQIGRLKETAQEELDGALNEALDLLYDPEDRKELCDFYARKTAEIAAVSDLGNADEELAEIQNEMNEYVTDALTAALSEITDAIGAQIGRAVDAALALVGDPALSAELSALGDTAAGRLAGVGRAGNLASALGEIRHDAFSGIGSVEERALEKMKSDTRAGLEKAVANALAGIDDEGIRRSLADLLGEEEAALDAVETLDGAAEALDAILEETEDAAALAAEEALKKMKMTLKADLDEAVLRALDLLEDEGDQRKLADYYERQMRKLAAVETLDGAKEALAGIRSETEAWILTFCQNVLGRMKAALKKELDETVGNALALLADADLKAELTAFYETMTARLSAVETLDGAKEELEKIRLAVETEIRRILAEAFAGKKTVLTGDVDEPVNAALTLLGNAEIRRSLAETGKINLVIAEKPESPAERKRRLLSPIRAPWMQPKSPFCK